MFVPLRTDRPTRGVAAVTRGLIAANVLVHLAVLASIRAGVERETIVGVLGLSRDAAMPWRFLTYQFMHDPGPSLSSLFHLGFNMLFLAVFGAAVEDRMGRSRFLAFYLLGGVLAGLGHVLLSPAPVIGASGAVCAVTGAFLVLYPRAQVLTAIVFFLILVRPIPAAFMVGFFVIVDLVGSLGDSLGWPSSTAYGAHLAGYAWGFGGAFAGLWLGLIPRVDFDLLRLLQQRRRRRAFARSGSRTWEPTPAAKTPGGDPPRPRRASRPAPPPPTPAQTALAGARREIESLVADHQLEEAATRWLALVRDAPAGAGPVVLSESAQRDVASRLAADGRTAEAAEAYRRLLEHYPFAPDAEEVRLLLGVLLARELQRPDEARPLLAQAAEKLREPDQRDLAQQLLATLPPPPPEVPDDEARRDGA